MNKIPVAKIVQDNREVISPIISLEPLIYKINCCIEEGMKRDESVFKMSISKRQDLENVKQLIGDNYHYKVKIYSGHFVKIYFVTFWPKVVSMGKKEY
jgi:hypothetical protein